LDDVSALAGYNPTISNKYLAGASSPSIANSISLPTISIADPRTRSEIFVRASAKSFGTVAAILGEISRTMLLFLKVLFAKRVGLRFFFIGFLP
jgi:hypothetical protein